MALDDYELLAARSFEEPHDADLRASVLVCADALGQAGDPRGPLIAMEHALHDADHKRAVELRKAMHEYASGEGSVLLGAAAGLMLAGRTLALEWRSGQLYGMSIDARYQPRRSSIKVGDLVKQALAAPVATQLRRLRVRVRAPEETRSVVDMLAGHSRPPPLEELLIYTASVWPQELTHPPTDLLQKQLPHLYYAVHETRVLSLQPRNVRHADLATYIPELEDCDPPTTPAARAFLGRCLTGGHRALRLAALARIKQLGPRARVFEHLLCALLQPLIASRPGDQGSGPTLPIVEALVATRPSRAARAQLEALASRPESYDLETRKLAGKATELDRR